MMIACVILGILLVLSISVLIVREKKRGRDYARLLEYTRNISTGQLSEYMDYSEKEDLSEVFFCLDDIREELLDARADSDKDERLMQEVISNISHDLKTPITTIRGYVEGLLDGICAKDPVKEEKYLRTIHNKSKDMDRLIDELMLYSKLGNKAVDYHFDRVKLEDYCAYLAEDIRTELEAMGIGFEYTFAPKDAYVMLDRAYFKRVIDNLVSNAKKSGAKNIIFQVLDEGSAVRVGIIDDGCGIDSKDVPRVFERFYRGDDSRHDPSKGSGIGLAIVSKIILDHKGKIWVESEKNKGTRMLILLRKQ